MEIEKTRTWCCWTLSREEIEKAIVSVCDDVPEVVTEDEIQQIVEDFKDAISVAFENWEYILEEIVENNTIRKDKRIIDLSKKIDSTVKKFMCPHCGTESKVSSSGICTVCFRF